MRLGHRIGVLVVLVSCATPQRAWGATTFTERLVSTVAPSADGIAAGDVDGDGDVDVTSGSGDTTMAWYESDGGTPPAFVEHVMGTCVSPLAIDVDRVDGDTDVDVVRAANFSPGREGSGTSCARGTPAAWGPTGSGPRGSSASAPRTPDRPGCASSPRQNVVARAQVPRIR